MRMGPADPGPNPGCATHELSDPEQIVSLLWDFFLSGNFP